jgi:hypothetical protein
VIHDDQVLSLTGLSGVRRSFGEECGWFGKAMSMQIRSTSTSGGWVR